MANPSPPQNGNVWAKFVAGGSSCMLISGLLNPMDVIKVRLQVQNQLKKMSYTRFQAEGSRYKGFFHAGKVIYLEEGYFGGLMKGLTPSLLRELCYSSLRMGLYEPFKAMVAPGRKKEEFTLPQAILAGALSGAIGSAICNPTDLLKIRFQSTHPPMYPNIVSALRTVYSTEGGIRGLYKGTIPTTLRASVLTSAQLTSYDFAKRYFRSQGWIEGPQLHLMSSIVAGLVTTTVVNPLDLIKTRWMTDASGSAARLYQTPLHCFWAIVTKEGPHALCTHCRALLTSTGKGWLPNYLRLGPHFMMSLPLFEFIRLLLEGL